MSTIGFVNIKGQEFITTVVRKKTWDYNLPYSDDPNIEVTITVEDLDADEQDWSWSVTHGDFYAVGGCVNLADGIEQTDALVTLRVG